MPAVKPNDLWTLKAASLATGVARTTILSAVNQGRLKCWRLGCGRAVVRLADIRALWPAKSTTQNTSN